VTPISRPIASLVALSVLVSIGGCDSPARPTPVARPPFVPPAAPPGPPNLEGSYALTIDIPDACDVLPPAERRRHYIATIEQTLNSHHSVHIVGGGYAERTIVGDIWNHYDRLPTIDWNNNDGDGCDGGVETLPRGDTLVICGFGAAVVGENSIVATVSASAIVDSAGRRTICSHPFLFTFLRQ
jgi:hypothetical protein